LIKIKILSSHHIVFLFHRITNYIELCTAWFDNKTHKELVNLKFTTKVNEAISSVGLMGLDKLYSFMIVTELQQIITLLQKNLFREKQWIETLDTLTNELTPITTAVPNPSKFYINYTQKFTKVWPKILDLILKIGQKQILRRHIAYELNINCRFNSKNLESSLRTVNE
jgi:WASH complex subunit strumpellin